MQTKPRRSLRFESLEARKLLTGTLSLDLPIADVAGEEAQGTIVDQTPPTVTGIYAAGSNWSPAFVDAVDGDGHGAGNGLGSKLTPGASISNRGFDRLYIQFSEPVVGFDEAHVALLGVNQADFGGSMRVSYDAVNHRGMIQLGGAVTREKLRLGVSSVITDSSGNALDGDDNGSAGGLLEMRFDAFAGDANGDGTINFGDFSAFIASFNRSAASSELYDSAADWNADGSVNGGDLASLAANFNQSLPQAEPGDLNLPVFVPAVEPDGEVLGNETERPTDAELAMFVDAFNQTLGSSGYNALVDWNGDGTINGGDLAAYPNRIQFASVPPVSVLSIVADDGSDNDNVCTPGETHADNVDAMFASSDDEAIPADDEIDHEPTVTESLLF